MRYVAVLLALVLLAFQPPPALVTVTECLRQSGFRRAVRETPITTLKGAEAWGDGLGERVLMDGINVGMEYFDDEDGARRMVSFHVYAGDVFVFVYKHPDDPARRRPGEAAGVWHGDCLLRITGSQLGEQP